MGTPMPTNIRYFIDKDLTEWRIEGILSFLSRSRSPANQNSL
jgi:hypothetical protein